MKSYKDSKFSMGRLKDLKEQWNLSSKCLGEGAFGKVYLAILEGKSYALKMLHKRKII